MGAQSWQDLPKMTTGLSQQQQPDSISSCLLLPEIACSREALSPNFAGLGMYLTE